MLDVRLLQTFREVAMRGSFSLAADELGFTQPAVSQHLARLERHLGVKLLERTARGVNLTPAGEALLAETEAVLSSVRHAERAAKAAGGMVASRLRVGAFPSAAAGSSPVRCGRRAGGVGGQDFWRTSLVSASWSPSPPFRRRCPTRWTSR